MPFKAPTPPSFGAGAAGAARSLGAGAFAAQIDAKYQDKLC